MVRDNKRYPLGSRVIARLVVLTLGLLLFTCQLCVGQVTSATLAGTIADTTGAGVPGASITATDSETGIATNTTSESGGNYVFPSLQPGTYVVTIKKTGFSTKTFTGVQLLVAQKATLDVQLQVGSVTTAVQVTAQVPVVQTSTASPSTVISEQQVVELPLNQRQYGSLALLSPGTVTDRGGFATWSGSSPFAGTSYAANGTRTSGNNYLVDGIFANALTGGGFSIQPTPDGVEEFRIQTNTYSAVFGLKAGSAINLVTKSGTNQIHGTAYEFLRNNVLDARNFFAQNQQNPVTQVVIPGTARPEFRRNQFGAAVGGPIKKNKTFFFGNYEGLRQIQGQTVGSFLPTAAQKGGDFSSALTGQTVNLCGAGGPSNLNFDTGQLFNPATESNFVCPAGSAKAGSNILVGQPIPGNMITSIDPVAQKALALYTATPNLPGYPNFINQTPGVRNDDIFQIRIDHNLSDKNQFFGRYLYAEDNQNSPDALPGYASLEYFRGQNFALGWTHTFGPTLLDEARFGFQRDFQNFNCLGCPRPAGTIAGFGIGNLTGFGPITESNPSFNFSGFSAQGGGGSFSTFTGVGDGIYHPMYNPDMVETYEDNLTWTRGRHTLVFGGSMSFWQSLRVQSPAYPAGTFSFSGQYSSLAGELPAAGVSPLADLELGYPSFAGKTYSFDYMYQVGGGYWSYYAQDDFRVSSNFVVNIGLRYEYRRPAVDKNNVYASFLPTGPAFTPGNARIITALPDTQNDALCADNSYLVNAGGTCLIASSAMRSQLGFTGRRQRAIIETEDDMFAPRLGLTWRPAQSDKLIIHTGFGLFYDLGALNNQHYGDNNPVFAPTDVFNSTFGASPTTKIETVFSASSTPLLTSQFEALFPAPDYKTPKVEEWSFGVESQLTQDFALEVDYVGNHGYDLGYLIDFGNQPLPGVGAIQPRRPYPDFNSLLYTTSWGLSTYNSLQVKATKRYSHGVTWLSSYTWGACINNNEGDEGYGAGTGNNGPQDYNDRNANRGPCENDATQRFVTSGVWQLPVGNGMRFLNSIGRLNYLVGGWETSGILSIQSGFPLTVVSLNDWSNTGSVSPRPDRTCRGKGPATVDQWFNSSCFSTTALQDLYQAGTPRFGNSGRGIVAGPRLANLDFALLKKTPITERVSAEFRAEFFNMFNHPYFGDPNTAFGSPLFGEIGSAGTPRDIQFGLKLLF